MHFVFTAHLKSLSHVITFAICHNICNEVEIIETGFTIKFLTLGS